MGTHKTSAQKVTCDVSPVDSQFRTPLHWAAVLGLSEVVRMLMDKGANPLIADSIGATALHYAVSEKCSQLCSYYVFCSGDFLPEFFQQILPVWCQLLSKSV